MSDQQESPMSVTALGIGGKYLMFPLTGKFADYIATTVCGQIFAELGFAGSVWAVFNMSDMSGPERKTTLFAGLSCDPILDIWSTAIWDATTSKMFISYEHYATQHEAMEAVAQWCDQQ